LLSLIEFA